jgi:hypothetical protein
MMKKPVSAFLFGLLGAISPLVADSLEQRLKRQEDEIAAIRKDMSELKKKEKGESSFPEWFHLGGEWELEYVDAQADPNQDASADSHAHAQHDKFLLKPKVRISDNFYMKGELEFRTGGTTFEEYHAHLTGLPFFSYLQVGLDERFSKADGHFDMANRKTENYPLIGTAFWRDEEFALIWGGRQKMEQGVFKDVFWRLQVSDGLELNEKQPTENDSYELTHDNDQASDTVRGKKEWGFGLGATFQVFENYRFDLVSWYFDSELNNDEKGRLLAITGYSQRDTVFRNQIGNRQERLGFRTTHKIGHTTLTYEAAEATDAKLRRKGYYLQASHLFDFDALIDGEFIHSLEALVRFEEYDVNLPPVFDSAETWDRQQTVYALIVGLTRKGHLKSTLKLEYAVNDERTGAIPGVSTQSANPDNNEFLAQLEIKF